MYYPDTSFLCALYVAQSNSNVAINFMEFQSTALISTSLLLYEFRQSVQFQIFRHHKNQTQGYPLEVGQAALAIMQSNIAMGVFIQKSLDWSEVHRTAENLAKKYTSTEGHRSFDILHVASAMYLGATHFLTFNMNQKKLAEAEGLIVPL
jgi:predicted nucleic acid-binding protein